MTLRIPLGISDFRELREKRLEYVDKTQFITEILDHEGIKAMLVPRPRRFGKTLNLSTLRWFFEKRDENLWHLFEGLHVARAGEQYRAHFQRYPVIFISFKGTRASTWDECRVKIFRVLRDMCEAHVGIVEPSLQGSALDEFRAILSGSAGDDAYESSLFLMTKWLYGAVGTRPIVLIDEYDAAIHSGFSNGYYDKAVGFFRSLLETSLKDNPHLERAVLTGILRVSKESIFSGLNNLGVYTLLVEEFNTCFGFTEDEVRRLLEAAELQQIEESVRAYYNGYEFGGVSIYNPWSILYFLASKSKQLMPYWVNTSTNELIKSLLSRHAFVLQNELQILLTGGVIEKELDENVAFPELDKNPRSMWSLLVFTGYLKAARGPVVVGQPRSPFRLSLPNIEVDHVYRTTFQSWMDSGLQARGGAIDKLLDALLAGRVAEFEAQLRAFALYCVSFHDVDAREPERFYQGLLIGLLAALEPAYEVRSNRESGEGRPDVLIKPRKPGHPGVVLELKAARDKKTLKQALAEGQAQLHGLDYEAELRNAGIEKVHAMVIAFDGKQVKVEAAKPPTTKPAKPRLKKVAARKTTKKAATKTASKNSRKKN